LINGSLYACTAQQYLLSCRIRIFDFSEVCVGNGNTHACKSEGSPVWSADFNGITEGHSIAPKTRSANAASASP